MQKVSLVLKKSLLSISVLVISLAWPAAGYADSSGTDPSSSSTDTSTTQTTDPSSSSTPSTDSSTSSDPSSSSSTPTDTSSTTPTPAPATDPAPSTSSTTPDTSSSTTPPPRGASQTGPSQPSGPDANTYTYNSATGLWENAYYTWDPTTGQTTPKTARSYSYNPSTGMWDTTQYRYDPTAGTYVPNTVSTTNPPAGAPLAATTAGPNSPITVNNNSNNNGLYNGFYNANISNNINANAVTGAALLQGNTYGGNTSSGNATSIANILNLLQSSASLADPNLLTFTSNIQGSVVGDLLIDPTAISSQLGAAHVANTANNNLAVNDTKNAQLTNNVAVGATSGDASANTNTSAGDVTSGNANAVANVMNLINSAVGSGQSFMGTVNIYGDLTGNILVPQDLVNQLLASNAPHAAINSSQVDNTNILADFANNNTINNNVTTDATTGNASANDNSSVGNVGSGNSLTNLNIFNLTGSDVIGSNDLLVFVNVLGTWVGMIMNAPAGSTAASLGGGITQDTTNNTNVAINGTSNSNITSNITAAAHSGDASANDNTSVGNVKSGNASASANLLNMINSHLSLSDWFGVLFINVFGTWNGSFGTPADFAKAATTGGANNGATSAPQVFQFVPTGSGSLHITPQNVFFSGNGGSGGGSSNTSSNDSSTSLPAAILASAHTTPHVLGTQTTNSIPSTTQHQVNWWLVGGGLVTGATLLGIERITTARGRR